MTRPVVPYGSWPSPVTAERVATAGVGFARVAVSGGVVWWDESRPTEGGRTVVVRREPDGTIGDALPEGWNARTRVHEYGGGAWWVHGDTLFFASWTDQRIYRLDPGADPVPITPEPAAPHALRYADGEVDPSGRWIVCVRESHIDGREPANEVVALPTDGSREPSVLASGADFYASPRLSPDGRRLAWLRWSHPNMPWDGTELVVAERDGDAIGEAALVAGGVDESVVQPAWSADGTLHHVSDRSGFWNIYRTGDERPVYPAELEFGVPLWVFGVSTYTFLPDGTIVSMVGERGSWRIAAIEDGALRDLGPRAGRAVSIATLGDRVVTIGGGPTEWSSVVLIDPATGEREVVRRASDDPIDARYTSVPEPIAFASQGGRDAFAFYYPPHNEDVEPPPDERPPLIVVSHGGPTAQTDVQHNPGYQFWTSRGFAVVDVNYGGSTGFGREYRRRLNGTWGIVDVEDCAAAARFLVERGDVDGERLAIRGGSAGGYTTLCALTFTDVFRAGANHYGVADPAMLARDTHKFESRYLDTLIGPYPERADLYEERSPLAHADRITCPVITFQGLEDEVVPPSQSERIVEALRRRGVPCAYVAYEGEQHGFRKADTIRHALGAELSFYGQVFGFAPAGDIEAVRIDGL